MYLNDENLLSAYYVSGVALDARIQYRISMCSHDRMFQWEGRTVNRLNQSINQSVKPAGSVWSEETKVLYQSYGNILTHEAQYDYKV